MIDTAQFPITLIFPPQGHFTQPYLALPCISAYLKANGFPDVELIDASIDSYDHFLSGEQLEHARARVLDRTPLSGFDAGGALGFRDLDGFRAAAESAASAGPLIDRIEVHREDVSLERALDGQRDPHTLEGVGIAERGEGAFLVARCALEEH